MKFRALFAACLGALLLQGGLLLGLAQLQLGVAWFQALGELSIGLSFLVAAVLSAHFFAHGAIRATLLLRLPSWPAWLVTPALVLLTGPWTGLMTGLLRGHPTPQETATVGAGPLLVGAFASLFLGPLGEELFFRAYLLRMPRPAVALLFSTCLFGLLHPGLPESLLLFAPFALITGYCALATRSVLPGLLGHVLWNGLLYFDVPLTTTRPHPAALAISGVLIVLLLGFLHRTTEGAAFRDPQGMR